MGATRSMSPGPQVASTCSLPWMAAAPSATLAAPLNSVYIALPPKVQTSGPRRGTSAWARWLRAGAFVHNFASWNWFVTLTFRFPDVTESRARGHLRRWLDTLAGEAGDHLKVAFAIEGHVSGAIHVHALVAFPESASFVPTDRGDDLWTAGMARVRVFAPHAGGAWYVTKMGAWDLTYGCPRDEHRCRRQRGCAFARINRLKT
jgi:hypothetical protein